MQVSADDEGEWMALEEAVDKEMAMHEAYVQGVEHLKECYENGLAFVRGTAVHEWTDEQQGHHPWMAGQLVGNDLIRGEEWQNVSVDFRAAGDGLMHLCEGFPPATEALGKECAQLVWANRGTLKGMKRGKAHTKQIGKIVQFGVNAGQIGRSQPGFCANSLRHPEVHRKLEGFVQAQWVRYPNF